MPIGLLDSFSRDPRSRLNPRPFSGEARLTKGAEQLIVLEKCLKSLSGSETTLRIHERFTSFIRKLRAGSTGFSRKPGDECSGLFGYVACLKRDRKTRTNRDANQELNRQV